MRKRLLHLLLVLLITISSGYGQLNKTVHLTEAGTLSSVVNGEEAGELTHLILTGRIDARDLEFIADYMGKLTILDMSETDIVRYREGTVVYPANEIPSYAFQNAWHNISVYEKIILPNSLEYIGYEAFYGCTVEEVVIGDNLVEIDEAAFGASTLKKINFPSSLEYIGPEAFRYCLGLTTIDLSSSNQLLTLEKGVFELCAYLETINMPPNLEIIKENCFAYCDCNFSLPASLKYIDGTSILWNESFYGPKMIICMATTPPEVTGPEFDLDPFECDLYVPVNSAELYRNAYGWRKFFLNFPEGLGNTGYGTPNGLIKVNRKKISPESNLTIETGSDKIIMNGVTAGERIEIYTIQGVKIYHEIADELPFSVSLFPGQPYLIVTESENQKIILK